MEIRAKVGVKQATKDSLGQTQHGKSKSRKLQITRKSKKEQIESRGQARIQ